MIEARYIYYTPLLASLYTFTLLTHTHLQYTYTESAMVFFRREVAAAAAAVTTLWSGQAAAQTYSSCNPLQASMS